MGLLSDFLVLFAVIYIVQAQLPTPPKNLKVYNILDSDNPKELKQGVEVYYKLDTAVKQHVKLKCHAEGHPTVRFSWSRNNREIDTHPDYQVDVDAGTLFMDTPSEGYYQCFAHNTYGKGLSVMVPVVRSSLPGFGNEHDFVNVQGTIGSFAKLDCRDSPASRPPAEFIWRLGESGSNVFSEISAHDTERIAINAKGTLYFIYLENADDSGSKAYYCGMVNGPTTQHGSPTRLNVLPGSVQPFGPELMYKTVEPVGILNKEVTLECIFAGFPPPQVVWRDKNTRVIQANNKFIIKDQTLTIKVLTEEDEGIYNCESSRGNNVAKDHIFLNVTSGPIPIEIPMDQIIPQGKNAVFNCHAKPALGEEPLGTPVWFKNGEPILQSNIGASKKFDLQASGTQLIVHDVRLERDMMCIQCNISNSVGYQFRDAALTVVPAIHVTAKPDPDYILLWQNTTSFTVEAAIASDDPILVITYEWRFTNGHTNQERPILNEPPHFKIEGLQRNTLIIDTENMNETAFEGLNGVLTCYIRNTVQVEKVTISVVANVPGYVTAGPQIGTAQMDLWWIALVIALVILIIVLILICCMCRQYPKGDYHVDEKERKAGHDPEKELADSGFHDLSRMDDDYDKPRMDNVSLTGSEQPLGSEEDDSLTGYGDLDAGKFTEDGSFIGIYMDKQNKNSNQSAV